MPIMTHYYYLILGGRVLNDTTRVCKVAVGASRQGDRDFLYLTGWACSHGFYFELVTKATSEFVSMVVESLKPKQLTVESFKARDIVRSIKATGAIPSRVVNSFSSRYQRAMLDMNYRIFSWNRS